MAGLKERIGKLMSAFRSENTESNKKKNVKADFLGSVGGGGTYRTLFTHTFNGEKDLGEIGPIKIYKLEYDALRFRSWQSFLESDITQMVIKRFDSWVIGKGLKMQAEPIKDVLRLEGIDIDFQSFSRDVEAYFKVFKSSTDVDFTRKSNLDKLASVAHINSIVGGDVLIVMRYEDDDRISIQLIDGGHIQSPVYGTEWYPQTMPDGNQIMNGIEYNARKEVVAYYVRQQDFSIVRVAARGESSGMQMAFMVYGMEYRLDNVRGIPLLSTVLESLKKLDRYKEATIGSAEERQKIAYSIEHDITSTGENPLEKQLARAMNFDPAQDVIPTDVAGTQIANQVAASTNKQAFNMPIGSKLQLLESKNELYFKDFFTVNINLICAAIGIPPEVAMSKYDSNFSASRAALKDWENTLQVTRHRFANQFYKPIYDFWLEIQILRGKIQAQGYVSAMMKKNRNVLEAYRNARFIGVPVPHIDPKKEVEAERLKLGTLGAHLPLTTVEAATENLGEGESLHNMEQFADELVDADKLKIKAPVVTPPIKGGSPKKDENKDDNED